MNPNKPPLELTIRVDELAARTFSETFSKVAGTTGHVANAIGEALPSQPKIEQPEGFGRIVLARGQGNVTVRAVRVSDEKPLWWAEGPIRAGYCGVTWDQLDVIEVVR